jgi:hypothetical protein
MSSTISLAVLEALKTELASQMPKKVKGFAGGSVKWYFTDTYIDPGTCPAICIIERGWTKTEETCRGGGLSQTTVGGMVWRRFTVEVMVWLKGGGTTDEVLRSQLQTWCDAVAAIMDASYQLETTQLIASSRSGANLETMRGTGGWFGVGQIRVDVDVFTQQGAVAL